MLIEIRPMAHPRNKWGVFHIRDNKFIATFRTELEAYQFAYGYLDSFVGRLERIIEEEKVQ